MGYKVIVTTPTHPKGVSYPGSGQTSYNREQAIAVLRTLVLQGHSSDYEHEFGAYAESPSERFTLADVTGSL